MKHSDNTHIHADIYLYYHDFHITWQKQETIPIIYSDVNIISYATTLSPDNKNSRWSHLETKSTSISVKYEKFPIPF